jgi:hypothetical protein
MRTWKKRIKKENESKGKTEHVYIFEMFLNENMIL